MIKIYSENEIKLFKSFGLDHLINDVDVIQLYKIAMEKAFVNNLTGSNVEALQRAVKAIYEFSTFRHTKEWEELIKF